MEKSINQLVILGLGSNLGNSPKIIHEAFEALEAVLTEVRTASLYVTEPMYVIDQGRFINTAVAGFYEDSPGALLSAIKDIEIQFGRNRIWEKRWGERFLDIDILLFGDLVVNEARLQIPHSLLKERRFALEPLLELLPDAREPGTGLSYREICDSLPEQGVKKLE